MSQWDKLLERLNNLSSDLRFEELKKILEHYGYEMDSQKGGSSHFSFRKKGQGIITSPKHKPIKRVYIKLVRDVVEKEEQ
ncbi:MAG: type II toxin-antitoxin system HicA family toxin [Phascolarctobacterium sp.]|nr:type II toxin-antitoxin system HicA family toxin [Phascolarctobacterium sp.]MEE1230157.1 type II toxin-antitoxin system HicA family toxin [Phascolarctobacterium sp.]